MKKYLGIIKVYSEHMSGVNVKILSKTYDDINLIKLWFDLYPGSEYVILENTKELDSMFEFFKDMTPITEEEKEIVEKARVLYKKMMKD
ncbi:MAG: hypothetical protein IJB83_05580 [Bacilli bacterium]|nr:hypothetical protein [Bacilli bacterium]